jgi:hypothetical protein
MRFMVLMKATAESEAGKMPSPELLSAMGAFNQQLIEAGVMLAGEGLQASAKGARLSFADGIVSEYSGPFPLTEDLVSGFWIWKTASLDEAVEWAMNIPLETGAVEIRQVFEMEDFAAMPDNVKVWETAQRQRLA